MLDKLLAVLCFLVLAAVCGLLDDPPPCGSVEVGPRNGTVTYEVPCGPPDDESK